MMPNPDALSDVWPGLAVPATLVAATNQGGTAQVPVLIVGSTSPPAAPVQQTGTPTPANVQNDPAASTVLTSAGGILGTVEAIVANPTQHIVGVIVLLVIAWFIWKHLR